MRNQENRLMQCKIIYLGIVGGLETPNNQRSGVVQIRDILHGQEYHDVCAQSFSPYVWLSGLQWVLLHFPHHAGRLTKVELESAPKVIIVGHSLGGWAALSVARILKRSNIPVELTVQIDSVGVTDHTVPNNVKAAAIFHARDVLMLLTTKKIMLEDPSQTRMVENVLVRGAGHESVTRDPRIRELVLGTVESLRDATAQQDHHSLPPVL
jgi:pimeloyl-ACP methyl ester carboxylesterase